MSASGSAVRIGSGTRGAGLGAGFGGRAGVAGRDGAGGGCTASSGFSTVLVASSSAMIRRMEARISSIDGSCAFAGCVIALPRLLDKVPSALRPQVRLLRAAARQNESETQVWNAVTDYVMPIIASKQRPVDCRLGVLQTVNGRQASAHRSRRRALAGNAPPDRRSLR